MSPNWGVKTWTILLPRSEPEGPDLICVSALFTETRSTEVFKVGHDWSHITLHMSLLNLTWWIYIVCTTNHLETTALGGWFSIFHSTWLAHHSSAFISYDPLFNRNCFARTSWSVGLWTAGNMKYLSVMTSLWPKHLATLSKYWIGTWLDYPKTSMSQQSQITNSLILLLT